MRVVERFDVAGDGFASRMPVGSKYSNDNQVSKFGGPRGPVESALPVG